MLLNFEYRIDGAKDAEELMFFKNVAVKIYNSFSGEASGIACGGFNKLIDTLRDRGVDFKGTWSESKTELDDPVYEELYDLFARGCFSFEAKKSENVRNERYLQLNGIDVVEICGAKAIIRGKILDL